MDITIAMDAWSNSRLAISFVIVAIIDTCYRNGKPQQQ